ncbi:MAG TPA: AAA family ATPase [Thermoanaerobaculia bacterium]|nr:AAA family ATPase [Thermoanaerobaculia bacterium]
MTEKMAALRRIALEAGQAFTPAAPIDRQALFAGRKEQLRKVVDTVAQRGQHAIIFGERGVGKTSLSNVLEDSLHAPGGEIFTAHVNCDSGDDYSSLWTKVFEAIELHTEVRSVGFQGDTSRRVTTLADGLPQLITSNHVRKVLTTLSESVLLIIIMDEFDRIQNPAARSMFADTIKMLSDHAVPATIVIVGVADTVDELLFEHQSIERALVQVHMPRMSVDELEEIITKGLTKLGMKIEPGARARISLLSRGLPHYTHALSLHGVRAAVDEGQLTIKTSHVEAAIRKALEEAQQSTKSAYHKAVMSQRKDNLYSQVLLACALAATDEMGYFAPADLRKPMSRVMGKPYEIANFIQHLNGFCKEERGNILQRAGAPRRYRYRFRNPLMQPFVTMQGFANGLLDRSLLEESS